MVAETGNSQASLKRKKKKKKKKKKKERQEKRQTPFGVLLATNESFY